MACLQFIATNGKQKRLCVYAYSRNEVELKLEGLKQQRDKEIMRERRKKDNVAAFLLRWLDESVPLRNKARTEEGYRKIVEKHLIPHLGNIKLTELHAEQVQEMINKLAKTHKPFTIRNIRACLRRALNHAIRWGYIAHNPATAVDLPRMTKYKIKPLTPEQARQLLQAVSGHRLEALFWIALHLGLRKGEILGLQWDDIDLEGRTLSVTGALGVVGGKLIRTTPKTEQSERILPLSLRLVELLKAHKEQQQAEFPNSVYVFTSTVGTPLDPYNLTRTFKAMLAKAGLPKEARFHDLRHSCATLLISQGVHLSVIKDILGHSNIHTTANVYGHVLPDVSRQAIDGLGDLLK
jgi:integrase